MGSSRAPAIRRDFFSVKKAAEEGGGYSTGAGENQNKALRVRKRLRGDLTRRL